MQNDIVPNENASLSMYIYCIYTVFNYRQILGYVLLLCVSVTLVCKACIVQYSACLMLYLYSQSVPALSVCHRICLSVCLYVVLVCNRPLYFYYLTTVYHLLIQAACLT